YQRLKNHKSTGTNSIFAELLKTDGASFNRIFQQILSIIWSSEKMDQTNRIRYQCGFIPGKSTTDQHLRLRQILEKPKKKIPTYHLFTDFRIPSKFINLRQMTLKFQTLRGFGQGDALSSKFFNILL
uniref:Reverse transcriptase domain-containing protein n=1 Tax=Megaselia scalaris TaxID=36166 RepID=T1GK84_MEGSC